MLKPNEMIDRLRRARRLVHEIHVGTDIPQIQSILRHADQNLHWALWNLGEVDELRPDLSGSATPRPATPAAGPKAKKRAKPAKRQIAARKKS